MAGPSRTPEPGWLYFAAIDLGLSRDASALVVLGKHLGNVEVIARPKRSSSGPLAALADLGILESSSGEPEYVHHQGSGKIRVIGCQVWKPARGEKVSIEAIEKAVIEFHERFRLAAVGADPWQAAYLIERLSKAGIATQAVDFVPGNLKSMASATLEAFTEHQIELFPHDQLVADLRSLRVEERGYGVRLTSPRGPSGHGDAATALSIGLHLTSRFAGQLAMPNEGQPLTCYP